MRLTRIYSARARARAVYVPRSSLARFLDKSFYTYPFLISENFLRHA